MTIQFDCPACKKALRAPDNMAGKYLNCPLCQSFVPVPSSQGMDIKQSDGSSGPPPVASIPQWYYLKNQQQVGPIPLSELSQLAATGQLGPNDRVWRKGMAEWTTARSIAELGAVQWEAPPPIPKISPPDSVEPTEAASYDVEVIDEARLASASTLPETSVKREGDGKKPATQLSAMFDRLRKSFPFLSKWSDMTFKVAVAALLVSMFLCCGSVVTVVSTIRQTAVRNELADADRLWTTGKQSDAVAKYKNSVKHSWEFIAQSERPKVLQRVIDFDADQGANDSAKSFIDKAMKNKLTLSLDSAKARTIFAQVRQEQEAAAQAKKGGTDSKDKAGDGDNRFGPATLSNDPNIAAARVACHAFLSAVESNAPDQAVSLCHAGRVSDGKADDIFPDDLSRRTGAKGYLAYTGVDGTRRFVFDKNGQKAYEGKRIHRIEKERLFGGNDSVVFEGTTWCDGSNRKDKFSIQLTIHSVGPEKGKWLVNYYGIP